MSGRRAAAIALSLVLDLADRLDAAGVTADRAPTLDEGLDAVWPLARELARLEKTAGKAGHAAARARAAALDCAAVRFTAAAGISPAAGPEPARAAPAPAHWRKFDAAQWRVELVPYPAPARERDREVA